MGEALALQFHATQKYTVYATARRLESIDHLASQGIHTLSLDVTSEASIKTAIDSILTNNGAITVLINNAGYSSIGPVVEQPVQQIENVLNTNVLGVVRVSQAVVPRMVEGGIRGLIINIGSVVSQMTTPFSAAYSASKAALLAVTDALRLEVEPFGIGVSYVTAGAIKSAFADNAATQTDLSIYERPSSLYHHWVDIIRARIQMSQTMGSERAEEVAVKIERVVGRALAQQPRPRPPVWFFVGGNARVVWFWGLLQKLFGWPTNGMLAKRFKLQYTASA